MQETHYNDGRIDRQYFGEAELAKKMREASENMADVQAIKFAKIGRNDPCPCGSGSKFKKCCISKMAK